MNDLQTQLIILAVIFVSGILSAYAIPYFVRRTKTFKKVQSTWEKFRSAQDQVDKELKNKEPAPEIKDLTPQQVNTLKKNEGFGIPTTNVMEQSKVIFTKEELVKPDKKAVSTDSINTEFPYKDLISERHVDKENEIEITKKEPTLIPETTSIKTVTPAEKLDVVPTPQEPVVIKSAPIISLGKITVQEKTERPVERAKEVPLTERQSLPIAPPESTVSILQIDLVKTTVPESVSPQSTASTIPGTVIIAPSLTVETKKVPVVMEDVKPLPDLSLLVERKLTDPVEKIGSVIPPIPVIQTQVPQVISQVAPVQAVPVKQTSVVEQPVVSKIQEIKAHVPQIPQDLWKVLHMQQETNAQQTQTPVISESIQMTQTSSPSISSVQQISQPTATTFAPAPVQIIPEAVIPLIAPDNSIVLPIQQIPVAQTPATTNNENEPLPSGETPQQSNPAYNPADSLTP